VRPRRPAVRVRQSIAGRDVLVLALEVTAEARSDTAWVPLARTQVTVLELSAGRIRRVLDYW
jgi:hypothetical protein